MRPRLRVPARRVKPSFVLRLAGLEPLGKLEQVLLLLPFLLDQLAAVVRVVALPDSERVLLDALVSARRVVVAECERRIVEQAPHDFVARLVARRHPDGVAELVELDAAVAEALLLGVMRHLLQAVADLLRFVLVAHRVTALRGPADTADGSPAADFDPRKHSHNDSARRPGAAWMASRGYRTSATPAFATAR